MIRLIFKYGKESVEIFANEGETLLDIAKHHNLPLEGACGGCLACATCHVILEEKYYKLIEKEKTDMEEDLLDYAFDLSSCSRLGCQVKITQEMNNMVIVLPESRNFNI